MNLFRVGGLEMAFDLTREKPEPSDLIDGHSDVNKSLRKTALGADGVAVIRKT